MRFILRTTLKLLILLIAVAIPLTLLVTLFALHQGQLPLWNIGARNVLRSAGRFAVPSLLIGYLLATLLVVALVDKMKVRSLPMLHAPPLLAGALLAGALYLAGASVGREQLPFSLDRNPVRAGVNTFVPRDAFVPAGDRVLYLGGSGGPLYLYDRGEGSTLVMGEVRTSRRGSGGLYLDPAGRRVVIHPPPGAVHHPGRDRTRGEGGPIGIPYAAFQEQDPLLSNPLLVAYAGQLRTLFREAREAAGRLERQRRTVLLGALSLSLLLLVVPMAYGLNDRGWGFAGVAGALLLLAVLPVACGLVLAAARRLQEAGGLGGHPFLFTAAVFALLGIVLDLVIALRGASR